MIKNKTTIIVGAGASVDVGFPVGKDLKLDIAKILEVETSRFHITLKNQDMNKCLQALSKNSSSSFAELAQKSNYISKQMKKAASIDNFLHAKRADPDILAIGKLAIALVISQCEHNSILSIKPNETRDLSRADKYFLSDFMNLFIRGHSFDDLGKSAENLSFIIFNYDRCVEHYVYHWLTEYFDEDCNALFNKITFQHTYGSLGDYQPGRDAFHKNRPEGPFLNAHLDLPPIAELLKVFTEQESSDVLASIEQIVRISSALIFLGFAYEEQNMRFFPRSDNINKQVFGTTFGFSEADQKSISTYLMRQFGNGIVPPNLASVKCQELFSEYSFSIRQAIDPT